MKRLLILVSLLVLRANSGWADTILITLDNPAQSGNPGDTLVFSGVLSNGGLNTIFLNSDTLNLMGDSSSVTDLFFINVPISLNPGQSSPSIELFNVTLLNLFNAPPGPYEGTYALVGGLNSNAQDALGSADFTVTVGRAVPEPSSIALLAAGLLALVMQLRKQSRSGQETRSIEGRPQWAFDAAS